MYGDLYKQTCILRYNPDPLHFIIVHPMTDDFEVLNAEIDATSWSEAHQKQLEEDIERNDPHSLSDGEAHSSIFVHIRSFNRQKLSNGLVYKLVKYSKKTISYIVSAVLFNGITPFLFYE
jgi:hypothetical protein